MLKQAGLEVVLVNSNPATIMTDRPAADDAISFAADEVYLEPLTAETIRRIIEKERPDGLLAGFGGQTGLTISSQLYHEGFLDRMGVKLLGTPVEAIDRAEDRELFKEAMEKIGQPLIPSARPRRSGRRSPLPKRSAIPSSCVRRSRWAARAAAWPTMPKN